MKNILVVNVNWIGDVIFSTPIFKALKQQYPNANIVCMAVPSVVPVLKSCPYIDEIIIYDERGRHKWPWGKIQVIFTLSKFHFDIVFLLHRSWTRAFLIYLAGIRQRVGYDLKDLGRLLTHKVELLEGDVHRCDYYLNVIESFGVEVKDRTTEIVPSDSVREKVAYLLSAKGISKEEFLVVVNTGGNWDLKRWPKECFAELIGCIMSELKIKVVIPGALKDETLVDYIHQISQVDPVVMAGKTNLEQVFALMERADVVVSSDSGPLHIASSVGSSTIAIFGPTRPEITGPRGRGDSVVLQEDLDCNAEACYQLDCPDNRCMKAVFVDKVVVEVKKFYQQWLSVKGKDEID